jgi:hypothetical protein
MKAFLCLVLMLPISFSQTSETIPVQSTKTGYNLSSPIQRFILPDRLKEVSGVTIIDSSTVAFIQDENGIIFIYDLRENRIKNQIVFGDNGDYEDLTFVNNTFYVLRSDGSLFEISGIMSKSFKVNRYITGVPSDDNEGLCYDSANGRLLIGCKGDIKKDKFKNKRAVFAFDIKTKKLIPEPVYLFDPESINRQVNEKAGSLNGKKDKKIKYGIRPSAICIHPKTGKLFMLSATDYILLLVNQSGTIENIAELDKDIFLQAEGISFYPDGDMLITNEAKDKKPILLKFNYKKDK